VQHDEVQPVIGELPLPRLPQDQEVIARRWAFIALGVLAACGSSSPSGEDDLAQRLLSNLSSVEQAALEDRVVSFGEYESSVEHGRECLAGLGFSLDPVQFGEDGLLSYMYGIEGYSDEEELRPLEEGAEDCYAEIDAVEAVYSLGLVASESERRAAEETFRDCAKSLGVELSEDMTNNEALSKLYELGYSGQVDVKAAYECVDVLNASSVAPVPGLAEALQEL
jgi:hypothetical protein